MSKHAPRTMQVIGVLAFLAASYTLDRFPIGAAIMLVTGLVFFAVSSLLASTDWEAGSERVLTIDGIAVTVESRTNKTLFQSGGIPSPMSLESEAASPIVVDDIRIGDPEFDARVRVFGNDSVCLSALSASARALLTRAVRDYPMLRISEGVVRCAFDAPLPEREQGEVARRLAEVVRTLTPSQSADEAIAASTRLDPVPAVRLRCLDALERSRPACWTDTAIAATRDPHPSVRLRAATLLADWGIVESIFADRSVEAAFRAAALRALLEALQSDEKDRALLLRALDEDAESIVIEAIGLIASRRISGFTARMVGLVTPAAANDLLEQGFLVRGPPLVRAALARAFVEFPDPAAEPLLIALLGQTLGEETRRNSIRALGKCGTIRAVEPLLAIRDGVQPLSVDAGAAIDEIQARLQGAGAGQLSVSSETDGRVSLANRGAVSVIKPG